MAEGILDGIRIVDCSIGLAGPEATRLLAEVGADVIKVEPPEGDVARKSAGFATWNRSKRGVVLDLRDQRDLDELDHLLETADIFVHGFRPSRAEELGLDDRSLQERHPNLIVCGITGYPRNHPDAERPGWDVLVQARSGAMWEVDGARPGPIFLRFPLPSWSTVYLALAGILTRLIVRERTGKAGPCHTSLYQGMLTVLALLWHRGETLPEMMKAKVPLPKGSPGPAMTMFECKDGEWLQTLLGFTDNPLLVETVAELGHPYQDVPIGLPTPEQVEVFAEAFAQRTRDEWLAAFYEGDVPAAPFVPLGSLFDDEQVLLNNYVTEVDDPEWSRARQTLAPYEIQPAPSVRGPAPALGGVVEQVLEALDLDASEPAADQPYPRQRPLEGVKILDFGMFLAGPFGPMLAGDLGAEVIKVEPLTGDRMRTPHQMMLFVACQRSKRAVAVDLQNPDSKSVLEALVKWADVVHHNLRMPKARKLGLDYDSVKAINPAAVYTHVSSYGSRGEKADWPGYDPMGQALSGWPVASSPRGEKPMWYRFGMMDHQCAMSSMVPTLLGLFHRDRTGEGGFTTSSLLGAATETNSETMLLLDTDELAPHPEIDSEQTRIHPGYGIYPVAGEQWVAIAAIGDERLAALRAVAGADDDDDIADLLADREADTLLSELEAAGVAAELVREDWEQGFFDSELGGDARSAVSYQHPEFGEFSQPGAFWDLGDLELRLDMPPPMLGQHTREILAEVGFDGDSIDKLVDGGIVGVYRPETGEEG